LFKKFEAKREKLKQNEKRAKMVFLSLQPRRSQLHTPFNFQVICWMRVQFEPDVGRFNPFTF
jgi:hypothetical protein